ncbi:MAG: alpha/beta hydrolase [Chitinophagaceae bacterium]|nr:alpha/beta hydrolase [Chitinophagaceae bacterium]
MKKLILLFFIGIVFQQILLAQYSLRLVVSTVATKVEEDIYVAGNFNNWNPKDPNYKLKPFAGGRKAIVLKDLSAGNYAFKFTSGSWDKVECEADGRDIEDRIAEVNGDLVIDCSVKGWKDNYPQRPKPYTASPQVKILDTAFFMPQLNKKRRIWIYLPKYYAASNKTYPVLYMHDGQNLFNQQTAGFDEWKVDESLDSLQKATGKECIVVGIDHGGNDRLAEYAPYDFEYNKTKITAQGKMYVDFLAQTLKPFIDSKYRTKKSFENTFIAGSSMGGLISLYAVMQYPSVFGTAGVFSPSLFIAKQLNAEAQQFNNPNPIRLYFYAGGKESSSLVNDTKQLASIFEQKQNIKVFTTVTEIGKHNEKYWQIEFPFFFNWIMN